MKICYECENYNHVDCVMRKKKSRKICNCWCIKKSSKYEIVMNKTIVEERDSTAVIGPDATVVIDPYANLIVTLHYE